ncbi:MAG: adenine deaminase [Armatimonadota bacterium]
MNSAQMVARAHGDAPCDILLRGAQVVNVFTGDIQQVDVAIADGFVVGVGDGYEAAEQIDVSGRFLCPGLIDAHMHLESTQVTLPEFARAVVPRGVTACLLDPHEIANVHGIAGIDYLLQSRQGVPLQVFIMAPSCVPATDMETSGARLKAADIRTLLQREGILGLGEMMNYPGVIYGDPEVLAKLEAAREMDAPIDGHAPGVTGADLCAYIAAGCLSDHECTQAAEADEKLARGMYVYLREGSSARNMADLVPAVTPANARRCCLCTDDRHPGDLASEGGVDFALRRAVQEGIEPVQAVQMATLNAAERFGLTRRGWGAIAPGYRADIVVLQDLEQFDADQVFIGGQLVARDGEMAVDLPQPPQPPPDAINIGWDSFSGLDIPAEGRTIRVIGLQEHQVITEHLTMEPTVASGCAVSDPDRDLLKLAVFERHHATGNVGLAFVTGLGLKEGAIASSVAHDSHNIVVAGVSDADMLAAVRAIERAGGGQVAVCDGEVVAMLMLPIAGLMSDRPLDKIIGQVQALHQAAITLGATFSQPFMALSFLALGVIPKLRLTDLGLVDVEAFKQVSLWAD